MNVLRLSTRALPALLAFVVFAAPTLAQDGDTVRVQGDRVVIEYDDGRIIVDGREVRHDDGSFVLRFDDGDREVVVVPGGHAFFRRGGEAPFVYRFEQNRGDFARQLREQAERAEDRLGHWQQDLEEKLHALGRVEAPRAFFGEFDEDGPLGRYGLRFEEHAEVARMEHRARELAEQAREAEGAERERLEQELEDHLEALFESKMEQRRERLARLERELQEERDRYEAREQASREIIERRMRTLLGERDVLAW